jgi:hypothetical protein
MSLDIKNFLGQYVKPNALKLGGEVAITDIEGGLVGLDNELVQLQDWAGDTLLLEQNEGARMVISAGQGSGRTLYLYGPNISTAIPEDGGTVASPVNVLLTASQQITAVTSQQIDLSVQSNNGILTLRAGSSASFSGIRIVSNSAGVGELRVIFADIDGGPGLPTGTASLVANQLWNDNGTLKIYTP